MDKNTYQKEIDKALEFIKNKKLLLKELQKKMEFYSEDLRFEEAMEIRDRIERINNSSIKSDIDFASKENYDIFVVKENTKKAAIIKIFMREGRIISSSSEVINKKENFDKNELLQRAILNFYAHKEFVYKADILTNTEPEDKEYLEDYLTKEFKRKTTITIPKRGAKKQLIDLALLNADEILKKEQNKNKTDILYDIKELFRLENTPNRIEIFDNSHMMGEACVGAMVVWNDGVFEKESYRHYHLDAKDEYHQMKELLTKRAKGFDKNSPPDLWVIDGGKTLLTLAEDIIKSSGANVDVISIAKEKVDAKAHRAKGRAKDILHVAFGEIRLKDSDKRLQFIQKLRDEAHRFAITFHKKTKLKKDKEMELLKIKGIGEAKIKKLLNVFGTFENIKNADFEQISEVLNKKDAKIIKNFYI